MLSEEEILLKIFSQTISEDLEALEDQKQTPKVNNKNKEIHLVWVVLVVLEVLEVDLMMISSIQDLVGEWVALEVSFKVLLSLPQVDLWVEVARVLKHQQLWRMVRKLLGLKRPQLITKEERLPKSLKRPTMAEAT